MSEVQNPQKSIKEHIVTVKTYIVEMPKKRKIIFGSILAGVILLAILITILINQGKSKYCVLYADMDPSEASSVYQTLQSMGTDVQLNNKGEVMVPVKDYDLLLLQLAAQGYPQTALTYDVFSNHSGLTATESQNQTWLLFQLQNRIQNTLSRLSGVMSSVVTITLPPESEYVWQQATNDQVATASVLLTLQNGVRLDSSQVTSIKNVVAFAVPNLAPENVSIVDAATMLELLGDDITNNSSLTDEQKLEMENTIRNRIEQNARRILSPRYGTDGVVAVASVTIDFDKMMTERMELLERADPNNGGYVTEFIEDWGTNGQTTVGGLVGEEDNTDIPTYPYQNGEAINNSNDYHREVRYDYGYLKTQVERGNAVLDRATVSVMVKEDNMTDLRREELVGIISSATDIDPDNIFVAAFNVPSEGPEEPDGDKPVSGIDFSKIPLWVYLVAGGVLLLIIALIVIIVLIRKRMRRVAEEKEKEKERALQESEQQRQDEIDQYKRELSEAAMAKVDPKDDAIVTEVRDFAQANPEIAANLLRNWLKEGE